MQTQTTASPEQSRRQKYFADKAESWRRTRIEFADKLAACKRGFPAGTPIGELPQEVRDRLAFYERKLKQADNEMRRALFHVGQ